MRTAATVSPGLKARADGGVRFDKANPINLRRRGRQPHRFRNFHRPQVHSVSRVNITSPMAPDRGDDAPP